MDKRIKGQEFERLVTEIGESREEAVPARCALRGRRVECGEGLFKQEGKLSALVEGSEEIV